MTDWAINKDFRKCLYTLTDSGWIGYRGGQLNITVFFCEKVTFPVYTWIVAYTGQVTLYKVPEKHGHV